MEQWIVGMDKKGTEWIWYGGDGEGASMHPGVCLGFVWHGHHLSSPAYGHKRQSMILGADSY